MKKTSCGILVLNSQAQILLCHATGTGHWDIPKGGADAGESTLETARRETAEECGLRFEAAELLDLGRTGYRIDKDLHLYAALHERIDTAACVCTSHYRDHFGRLRPEMDGFVWTPFPQIAERCTPRMTAVLTQTLHLPGILERLLASYPVGAG